MREPHYHLKEEFANSTFSRATIKPEHLLERALDILVKIVADIEEHKDNMQFKIVSQSSTHGLRLEKLKDLKRELQNMLTSKDLFEEFQRDSTFLQERNIKINYNLRYIEKELQRELSSLWKDLVDELQYIAPKGCSFTTIEGDGAHFVWRKSR